MRQHFEECKVCASRLDRGSCEVLDLICNDMGVGAASSHKEAIPFEQEIVVLYGVDEEIEVLKSEAIARKEHATVKEISKTTCAISEGSTATTVTSTKMQVKEAQK
jgi:urease alpha subunit